MSTTPIGVYADYALKALHNVSALLLLVSTFTLMGITMTSNSTQNSLYLTTSYLATFYTDTPPLAWAPAGDPYHPQRVADTFYDCLYAAQVGFGGNAACGGSTRSQYDDCINGITASPVYGQKETVAAIQEILAGYTGSGWNVSVLPSIITNTNTTQLAVDLAVSSTRLQIVKSLTANPTALSNSIVDILIRVPVLQLGVAGCLSANSQAPGILHDIAPVYDSLWQCASTIVKTTSDSKEAYDQCIPLTAWPTLDVMQTPYSSTFLGCYNKYFVLIIGSWLLTSFAVYTLWLGVDGLGTETGKPGHWFSRCGIVLAGFCFLWNGLGALVMVLVRSFGNQSTFYNFPMSVQTVLVTWFFALIATMYFGRELWEHIFFGMGGSAQVAPGVNSDDQRGALIPPPGDEFDASSLVSVRGTGSRATIRSSTAAYGVSRAHGVRRYANLSYFMRTPPAPAADESLSDPYTPLLSFAWSDSWIFSDGLILLGIIGTSPDVVTADLVRVFLSVIYGTIVHTAFVRLLYEGYVNDAKDNEFRSKARKELRSDEKSRDGVRVMAMIADVATLLFMIVTWFLVYGRYGGGNGPLVLQYVLVCSNIPYVFWFVYNLLIDFEAPIFTLSRWGQMIFIYNLITRATFILIAATQANKDADANFSGALSLQKLLHLVNA